MATPRTLAAEAAPPSLWDPVVRLTHWGIAVSVLVNAALNEGGSLLHVSLGWLVMALLLLRLVWGGLARRRRGSRPSRPIRWQLCGICGSWPGGRCGSTLRTTRRGR